MVGSRIQIKTAQEEITHPEHKGLPMCQTSPRSLNFAAAPYRQADLQAASLSAQPRGPSSAPESNPREPSLLLICICKSPCLANTDKERRDGEAKSILRCLLEGRQGSVCAPLRQRLVPRLLGMPSATSAGGTWWCCEIGGKCSLVPGRTHISALG